MNPTVSVIIPCYNHGIYIEEAIRSVEQSMEKYLCEIIVIDDGSTDELTVNLLREIALSNHTVIFQANQGLGTARNNGIAASTGKYILPLDSDNKVHENYLNRAIDILEADATVDIVYGNPLCFGANNGNRELGLREVGEFNLLYMLNANYIDACAVYKRAVWDEIGGYDSNMPFMGHEDWEMWIHAALLKKRMHYLNDICYYYRVDNNSMSSRDEYTSEKHKSNKEYIYKKHSVKIIELLLDNLMNCQNSMRSLEKNRFKSIVKIVLKYKL